jgi:transposase, IS5 family
MIDVRRQQRRFGDGFIRETVDELWEGWMRHADTILADEELLEAVHHALQQRRPHSRTHGRPGTPAEVVLRMLLLKHLRDWSFADLEREVRGNLLYREFTRWEPKKCRMAKPWGGWPRRWDLRSLRIFMPASSHWRKSARLSKDAAWV